MDKQKAINRSVVTGDGGEEGEEGEKERKDASLPQNRKS